MPVGTITGTTTTTHFSFKVDGAVEKFCYICFDHQGQRVLAQATDLVRDSEKTLAHCAVLGIANQRSRMLTIPPIPGTTVELASDDLISDIVQLRSAHGGLIGFLDGKQIPVLINLEQILTKHLAILAKSGAGKSYTVGVLLEEILKKGVPLVIIDAHGEYVSMKYPNESEREQLSHIKLEPISFLKHIQEFDENHPLLLPSTFDGQELVALLPARLNTQQQGLLYSCLQNNRQIDFEALRAELMMQESQAKWGVIDLISYVEKMNIFSRTPTPISKIVTPGKATLINLKGRAPEEAEILVAQLCKLLFDARKKGIVPPFFLVVEEAHNFCPERSFGETKSSRILRTIASEGRKFGLGLAIISQRPARVDKSVLSQCSTQIILKITNPADVKAISSSMEGMTKDLEDILPNLPIGTAVVSGIVDLPLLVRIRPRQTKHGGDAAQIFEQAQQTDAEPVILPTISKRDLELMKQEEEEILTYKIPAVLLQCQGKKPFQLLVELNQGKIVTDINNSTFRMIPPLTKLSPNQLTIVQKMRDGAWYHAADFMKEGLDFAIAHDLLGQLAKKGIFEVRKDKFRISDEISLNLEDVAYLGKVSFVKEEGTQLPQLVSIDEIKKQIHFMVPVLSEQPCTIIWYKTQQKIPCAELSDQLEEQ